MKDILQLTVAERIQLAEDIWESIVAQPDALPLTAAQRKELDRRLEAHKKTPTATKSWEQVRAKLKPSE